jgi:hypothetical protein
VQERGWAGLKNGPLLRLMREARVEAFVTTDRNLEYQQNVAAGFAVFVLVALTNTLEDSFHSYRTPRGPGALSARAGDACGCLTSLCIRSLRVLYGAAAVTIATLGRSRKR